MGRAPCCDKVGLKKGAWSSQEDRILINYILQHGPSNWRSLPKKAGLLRCGKSCRLRWTNYLRPDVKRGNFTKEEEETIITLQREMGNRWSAIAARLPGRTDNEIKNMWHTIWKKKVANHNNNPPDSIEITNQDISQKQSSPEASDNPTSSDTRNVQDDIEAIDDNFWSEVLSSAADSDDFGLEANVQFSGPNTPLLGTGIDTDTGDHMDFWCDLFMAAAGDFDPSNTIVCP